MSRKKPDPIAYEMDVRDFHTGESRRATFHVERLLHGTDAVLNPGDIIEARARDAAFATDSLDDAKGWANFRSKRSGAVPRVYEVEPADGGRPFRQRQKYSDGRMEYVHEAGYRVRRQVSPRGKSNEREGQ